MKFKIIFWLILFFTSCFAQHQSDFIVLLGKKEDTGMQFTFSGATAFSLENMQGTGDVTFDWGDGTKTTYTLTSSDQDITHTYSDTTKKTVRIDKPESITKWYMDGNAGIWNIDFNKLINLTYLYANAIGGTFTVNSADLPNLNNLLLIAITGTFTVNSADLPNLNNLQLYNITGTFTVNSANLPNLNVLYLRSITGTFTVNSADLPNLNNLQLYSITGTLTVNSSDLPNLTYLFLFNIPGTLTVNSSDLPNLNNLFLQSITCDISYTTHTWVNNQQRVYINVGSGGLTACEIDAMYADLANVSAWTGSKQLTIIGNGNAERTTASDADKATIVSKGVVVTDNGNEGVCP